MNSLDDLLDQIGDGFRQLSSRLQESSAFNTLREKFDTLPTSTQGLLKTGSVAALICILFLVPISGILSSSAYIQEYEEKKQIIEGLIQAEQTKRNGSPLPPGLTSQSMQQRIQGTMQYLRLVDGQGPEMSPLGGNMAGNLVPKTIQQAGLNVNFFGLNLKQVSEIGAKLEAIDSSVKMIGLKIQPSKKFDEYYDASFQLVSFSLPELEAAGATGDSDASSERAGSRSRRGSPGSAQPPSRRRPMRGN